MSRPAHRCEACPCAVAGGRPRHRHGPRRGAPVTNASGADPDESEVSPTNRPLVRPCPPFRPRGPACSRQLVGLLTPRLGRLHAFSRSPRRRNGARQPASSPGHSGGAVPESHRSSLFAGRGELPAAGHQSQWENVPVVPSLSTFPRPPAVARRVCHACPRSCETLPVAGRSRVKPCRSFHGAPHRLRTHAARQSRPHWHPRNSRGKSVSVRSSRLRHAADSPPCPPGHHGARRACSDRQQPESSSHGLARQACRE